MNRYDLPLIAPVAQSLIPVMHEDGRVVGFYPISSTTFPIIGTPTTHITSDGVVVPLKVVTLDENASLHPLTQYVAAVFEVEYGIISTNQNEHYRNAEPWASNDLVSGDPSSYSWYTQGTQTWFHHFGKGNLLTALTDDLNLYDYEPPVAVPPEAENATAEWKASVEYLALYGDCSFFDFNWMTVFKTKTQKEPLRIVVTENPPPIPPSPTAPLVAKVIGIPTYVNATGVIYDSIRILKLADTLPIGDYVFKFNIYDTTGQTTEVTFTLTIK